MADIVGFFWTKYKGRCYFMKGSESQKWSVNFIDGYFEYILSLYKKEESSPKCYMDLLIIISDAIDYLKDPVWEEVGYSICKKI